MRTKHRIDRIVAVALAGLLVVGALGVVGIGTGLTGLPASPSVAYAAENPQPAWMPRALIVDAYGAWHTADDDAAAAKLSELGFIVDRYENFAAPDYTKGILWPHWTLANMFRLNTYNVVVYYGHGNTSWGWNLSCDPRFPPYEYPEFENDPRYPIEDKMVADRRNIWKTWTDKNGIEYPFRLAENAMVLMAASVCYSDGVSAEDIETGAPLLSEAEVLRRINEYSYTFLHREFPGAGTYVACPVSIPGFLDTLAQNPNTPIGRLAVPDYSSSGATLLEGSHAYMGAAGMRYRKNRWPGDTNRAVWMNGAWAGDPGATFITVGYVPQPDPNAWNGGPIPAVPAGYDTMWYFAEGYTGVGFQEYLTLGNPFEEDATAQVLFLSKDGTWKAREVLVPGLSRATVDVNASAGPDREVSARVCSAAPLVAERPMYFNWNGWDGGHDVVGYGP